MSQDSTSVMNNLHKIGDQLSESAKQISGNEPPDSVPEEPPKKQTNSSVLDKALQRRFDEYRKTRRDLVTRLNSSLSQMETDFEQTSERAEQIRKRFQSLTEQLERMKQSYPDAEELNWKQSELAEKCSGLEVIRLETIRTVSAYQAMSSVSGKTNGPDANAETVNFDKLTFGFLFKKGFAFLLPLILAILLSAFLISAAYLGAFSGFGL